MRRCKAERSGRVRVYDSEDCSGNKFLMCDFGVIF